MNESKDINELRGDPQNPRSISKRDFEALKKSITEFGDLSGIVLNVETNELVGGHQRVEAFKSLGKNAKVQVTQKFDQPSKTGTIAIGYVTLDGEAYGYREVKWDKTRQQAANIAANRISGEFDVNTLAEVTYQIAQSNPELLDLTGQTEAEVKKLMQSIGVVEDEAPAEESQDPDDERNELIFSLTREQSEVVMSAIDNIRINREIPSNDNKAMNGAALFYMAQDYNAAHPPVREEFVPPEVPTE